MLYRMFTQTLKDYADKAALVHGTSRMSYRELYGKILSFSEGLLSIGLLPGSRVALILPNCPEFLISYYAIARLQAIFVPLSPLLKEEELKFYINDCKPSIIITDLKRVASCQHIISQLDSNIKIITIDGISPVSTAFAALLDEDACNIEDDSHSIYDADMVYHYSSGSTGRPKRVPRTQSNLFYDADNMNTLLSLTPSDTLLCTVPLFHSYGQLLFVLMPMRAGATLVLLEQYTQEGAPIEEPFAARCPRVLELIAQEQVTLFPAVPYIFSALAETPAEVKAELNTLRACFSAGSFLPRETFERFQERFGIRIRQTYGTTEGGLIAANIEPAADVTYDSVGISPPNVEVKILSEDLVALPAGVVGEVVIRSPTLTTGYANMPALNREAFRDGYYFTGDLGKKDEKGHLYLTGRKKFLLDIAGGHKVDPLEIEDVLMGHAKVAEAAVVGAPGPYGDRVLKAFVIAREQCTEEELIAHCHERLANFKVPQGIEFRTEFPRSSLGKVLREELLRSLETSEQAPMAEGSVQSFFPTLLATHEHERSALLESYLCRVLAKMLRVAPSALDTQQHLTMVGLDSLIAVQLKHRLETDLGMSVSLVQLLQGLTIAQITTILLEQFTLAKSPQLVPLKRSQDAVYESALSYGQSALWYLYLADPASAAFNTFFAMHILSSLDISALHQAFQQLVDRHASLRTVYAMGEDGKPVQRILKHMPVNFEVVDVSHLNAEALDDALVEASHQPFDLRQESALRVHLFTGADQKRWLLLTAHHIATDFWSMVVLVDELRELYQAQRTGVQAELAPLHVDYTDYLQWEARLLESPAGKQSQLYWRQQLSGDLPVLNLSTDRLRSPMRTSRGARYFFSIDKELTAQIRQIARSESVTLYTLLLTVFQILLARYSGQTDFFVGSPTMIRSRSELQNLVGYLVNPVVLRAHVEGDATFRTLLRQVSDTVLGALEHQDYSFLHLVEDLLAERDPSRSPIFDVMFVLDRPHRVEMQHMPEIAVGKPDVQMDLGGFLVEAHALKQQTAQFDLTLVVIETDRAISTSWEYNTDLFDKATIERMVGSFHQLLRSMVAHPEQAVLDLQVMGQEQRQQLLETWNATQSAYAADLCVHQRVEEQVFARPDAVAIVCEEMHLTYYELNRRAERLAAYLQYLGVGPDTLVGICMERAVELFVGILGILKAGGAYVPLDPAYPSERLAFMMQDAHLHLLLTQERLRSTVPADILSVLCLDTEWSQIAQFPQQKPANVSVPQQLAYVIYTSGSTGRPKGTLVTHQGILSLSEAQVQTFGIQTGQRILQCASLSFDASVWETVMALLTGGTLCLPSPGIPLIGPQLFDQLFEQAIEIVTMTPSALSTLPPADLPALTTIIVAGEACPLEVMRKWSVGRGFFNAYGPTEVTIWASVAQCQATQEKIHIGRPIANARLYVLDRYLQPVPVGVPGELFISSMGLARGYLGRAELTAERFIAHPYSQDAGARLYRTGDLVRYLPDGNIEYLGRIDHQVKVRGYRIELGEIDTVISQYPGVQEAVTIVREDVPGDKRLTAYLVADPVGQMSAEIVAEEQARYLATWQELYEQTYRKTTEEQNETFNIAGWNSSYSGDAIPEEEMREQVEQTIERILALRPQRLLEIGCGTGLLLFQVAPFCQSYLGTDFSAAVLAWVGQQAARWDLNQVRLLERVAHDFTGLETERFDTIVVNSTIQYFPSIEYLANVLEQALRVVEPGGQMLLGDVRSFRHLELYHSSVQLFKAADTLSLEQLQQRVHKQMKREEELTIEPAFFRDLKEYMPQVGSVHIQLRQGRHHNELTRFRYDVVLHIGMEIDSGQEDSWEWQSELDTLETVRQRLVETTSGPLRLHGVPNARLWYDARALEILNNEGQTSDKTVGELRTALLSEKGKGIDPEEWWQLGADMGYGVEVMWSEVGVEYYDVLFRKEAEVYQIVDGVTGQKNAGLGKLLAGRRYANSPLQGKLAHKLVPQLSAFLDKKLPEYMLPSAFVLLDALPLTSNGKLDRLRLPAPEQTRFDHAAAFVAPRTPVEQMLTEIIAELIGLEQVGIRDNFFELGGHSLLVMQLISRVRATFQVELPFALFFEEPTVAGLAEGVERERREGQDQPLTRIDRTDLLPVSFAQERLWFLDQLTPNNPFYNLPVVIRLQGPLIAEVFARSLQAVVQRHEALRSTFTTVADKLYQKIEEFRGLPLPCIDLTELSASEREAEVQRLSTGEMQQPFNLAQGPLLRAKLLQVGKEEHVLLLIIHHIASDGWSVGVLIRDLAAFYEAFSNQKPVPLPELSLQYADFAAWQRQWLQGEVVETQLAYWKQQLQDVPMLQFPTDRPRPLVQSFRGAHYPLQLSRTLTKALKTLSQQEGVTLFMTLQAAFQLLLSRYTGVEDVAIGVGIANRNRREIEEMIGFFVNTLVMRADLSGNPSFRALLRRVRAVALEAYANQDLPFERLVAELQPERNLAHQPLFQVMFIFQNFPMPGMELSEVSLSPIVIEGGTAKFDLTLSLDDVGQGLNGWLEYSTDLFEPATIERLVGHWQHLLESIVAHPESPTGYLPLLAEQERQQLLVDWNTVQVQEADGCLHTRFEEQVGRVPDAVALVFDDLQLSYADLNRRANQLAHALQERGIGPEVGVGLFVERGVELVVGLLGILKAGGAYVPLDPAYPPERLAFMLADSQVSLLLTQQHLQEKLPPLQAIVLCIDTDWPIIVRYSSETPDSKTGPSSLLYTLYTSGSTGRPKGTLITHANVERLFAATQDQFHFAAEDTWTLFHSHAFDFSVWELWGSLLYGGRLVVVPYWISRSPEAFYQLLCQQRVTVLNQTPSAFQQLIQAETLTRQQVQPALRLVIFGGEALEPQSLRPWFQRHGDQMPQLINMYGITETTVHVTSHLLTQETLDRGSVIGRAIPDLQLYLLDRYLQPVPVGVVGELYVGGAGLARGYFQRPELTAERFIPHPYSSVAGARLYKTGDLGRYQADGMVEYQGRADHQVKIRGFRIELGEIEAVLSRYPGVREVVVLAREDSPGDKRLVAYLVAEKSVELNVTTWREYLKTSLPDYMVPAAFVLLEAMPLTEHGKVDRRALPQPDQERPEQADAYIAPRNATEQKLAEIWARVLKVKQVGIYDNFFALGGDSILSIQVLSQAREQNIPFSLQQLFQHQSIAELIQNIKPVEATVPVAKKLQAFSLLSTDDRAKLELLSGRMNRVDKGDH